MPTLSGYIKSKFQLCMSIRTDVRIFLQKVKKIRCPKFGSVRLRMDICRVGQAVSKFTHPVLKSTHLKNPQQIIDIKNSLSCLFALYSYHPRIK